METRQPPAGSERKSRSDVPAIWLAASVMRRDEPTRRSTTTPLTSTASVGQLPEKTAQLMQ